METAARSEPASLAGHTLGRYEVLHWLAAGGMANVYVARAVGAAGFQRLVALKALHPHLAREDEFVAMFLDEARLAARIRHPNVVATLDVVASSEEGHFLVMEYVEGDHLGALLSRAGRSLPVPAVLRILADGLAGLHAAHELTGDDGLPVHLVHRDVSPSNLLVGVDGVTRVTDFGIARAEVRLAHTREGQFKGKIGYMSPEQVAGKPVDRRADLFGAGTVLWEALTGSRLFRGEDTVAVMSAVLRAEVPSLASVRPELAALAPVLDRALARRPADRFSTAAEMLEALEGAAPAVGGLAAPREVGEMVRRLSREKLQKEITGIQRTLSGRMRTPTTSRGLPVSVIRRRRLRRVLLVAGGAAALVAAAAAGFLLRPGSPAEAAPVQAEPVVVADEPPRLLAGELPVSPDPAMSLSPTVVLRLTVAEDGSVREAKVYRPRADLAAFEQAALAAVRTWRFQPGLQAGQPVAASVNWPVRFAPAAQFTVRIKGSDTIGGALGPDLGRAFAESHPGVRVEVGALGSATGFVGLFDGTADLAASSRAVKPAELEEAARLGIRLQEFVIGYDGLAVIVHAGNPVKALTVQQLSDLFTGKVTRWREVGGRDLPVTRIARPSYSGTHAFFLEKVLRGGKADGPEVYAADTRWIEHSGDIADEVARDPGSISFVGIGWISTGVRALAVSPAPGKPAISPSFETVEDGSYPVARPLMMYTRGAPRGMVAEFLRFVLGDGGKELVKTHGFIPGDAGPEVVPAEASAPAQAPRVNETLRVFFPAGGAALDEAARQTILHIATRLASGGEQALVVGNADAEGSPEVNRLVAGERARVVMEALVQAGVAPSRVKTQAAASERPLASNDSGEGRALNRRVDVYLAAPP